MTKPPDTPVPIVATGADSLVGVLRDAADRGYRAHFTPTEPGRVVCGQCERSFRPDEIGIDGFRRLEGASDAADMSLVAWGACPECGTRGGLTLGYGPNAAGPDLEVLAGLDLSDATSEPPVSGSG